MEVRSRCLPFKSADSLPLSDATAGALHRLVLIPGGFGTRKEVDNGPFIEALRSIANGSQFVLTVCTGSALLARAGLLSGRRATSNKRAFDWVVEQDRGVLWKRKARWIRDDKYYTSSGVSAGIDMTLGFVGDRHGTETAERISRGIEYLWNRDSGYDPFC